jgi:hypothetical protein
MQRHGISLHTCFPLEGKDSIALNYRNRKLLHSVRWGTVLENMYCLRCNRELGAGHKSVAIYLFAQTVGIKPRQKSAAQRICFCPQCSVSLAMGPPPEGALNLAAWEMIRDLVGSDPALNQAAWQNLSAVLGALPPTGTAGARLSATSGGYFEF